MEQQLGEQLRNWRAERGLSLGALASRAGVAKGTLSGWERGLHQPRLPELEAVLAALGVPTSQGRELLSLIDAPRADRALAPARAAAEELVCLESDDRPVPGHLLKAMRLRRGLTLEQVAREAGVNAASISRWERSEHTPSIEFLLRLLAVLGARPEECDALLSNPRRLKPPPLQHAPTLESLEQRLAELANRITFADRALMDLELLAWEAEIWPLAVRSNAARELLGVVWSGQAEWLRWDGRLLEARSYSRRAIQLLRTLDRPTIACQISLCCAVQVWAGAIARDRSPSTSAAALAWLQRWLPLAPGTKCEVELCRRLAEHAWGAEQPNDAIAFVERACSLAERLGDQHLYKCCQFERAGFLLRLGRSQEACALLARPSTDSPPYGRLQDTLRWASAMHGVGDPSAAHWLAEAYALIEQSGYVPFRATADALSREL
jgi:transcriptional regulator with XRE-family HTH domain